MVDPHKQRDPNPSAGVELGPIGERAAAADTNEEVRVFNVEGMTCMNCVGTITEHLKGQPYVSDAVVDLETKKARVVLRTNAEPPSSADMCGLFDEIGFEGTVTDISAWTAPLGGAAPVKKAKKPKASTTAASSFPTLEHESKTSSSAQSSPDQVAITIKKHWPATESKRGSIGGTNKFVKIKMSVDGMSCASCTGKIEKEVKKQPGVQKVSVSLLMEEAEIVYDPEFNNAKQLVSCIDDLGFTATLKGLPPHPNSDGHTTRSGAVTTMKPGSHHRRNDSATSLVGVGEADATVFLEIGGMTCGNCVTSITNALLEHKWCIEATANYALHEGMCRYDSTRATVADVITTIESVGYTAMVRAKNRKVEDMLERKRKVITEYYRLLLICLFFGVPVFFFAMVLPYIPAFQNALHKRVSGNLSLTSFLLWILCTPVQFYVGAIFYKAAWKGLVHCSFNMSLLVVLGTTAAYAYAFIDVISDWASEADTSGEHVMGGEHFFETSSTLITFVILGRYLENIAKGKTSEALTKLMSLQASFATVVTLNDRDEVIEEKEVPAELLKSGDVVKVLRGQKIPADGVVQNGTITIDESMITGEPMPALKNVGDPVIGSTVIQEGQCRIACTQVGEDTKLSQIVRLMENAQSSKAPIQAFADQVSSVFVPFVIITSLVTFFLWLNFAEHIEMSAKMGESDFLFAFLFGLAVMVIACPCALGLATPTAVMVGTGVAASLGVLIKGGEPLQRARKISAFIFDKTGTLTVGRPVVTEMIMLTQKHTSTQLAFLVGSAELSSEHVIAKAIVTFAKEECGASKPLVEPTEFEATTGRGLQCNVDGHSIVIGNREWIREKSFAVEDAEAAMTSLEKKGQTALTLAVDGEIAAVMGLSDIPKPEAAAVVAHLKQMNIEVWMCTGDNKTTAQIVGKQLGIDNIISQALPQDKLDLVEKLQGEKHAVAMIGDGINDSIALAQADLGISVGAGTDVAIESAQIILVKNDLRDIITALDVSRVTLQRIYLNYVFAMAYNILAMPIAAGVTFVWWRWRLPPEVAALAMAMSSVSVVVSSLLLKRYVKPVVKPVEPMALDAAAKLVMSPEEAHDVCCSCGQCSCPSPVPRAVNGYAKLDNKLEPGDMLPSPCHKKDGQQCVCNCKDCQCKKNGTLAQPLAPARAAR